LFTVVDERSWNLGVQIFEFGEISRFHTAEGIQSVFNFFASNTAYGTGKGLAWVKLDTDTSNNWLTELLLDSLLVSPKLDDVSFKLFLGFLSQESSLTLFFLL